jgi:hypothetical protein
VRLAAVLLAVLLLALGPAAAVPGTAVKPGPVATSCWPALRLFDSLATGTTDFCRGHLAYTPGALDCYRFLDHVCAVFLPASNAFVETRRPVSEPLVFPCPDGPEPPVCRRLRLR